ncbi:MAG: hypothetical protein AAF581_20600 [Planctomycetota bacterium]
MAHVDKDQLYPFFYALGQHVQGIERIEGVQLDDELARTAERLPKRRFSKAPAEEHRLDTKTLQSMVKHAEKCKACRLIVLEDGPSVDRKLGTEEEAELARAKLDEESRAARRFFLSLTYGVLCFMATFWIRSVIQNTDELPTTEATIGTETQLPFNPLWLVWWFLILVASWGLADCWIIANRLWLDWSRAQKAVPVVGERWAARTARKRKERGWD